MHTKIDKTNIRLWAILAGAVIVALLIGAALGTFILAPQPAMAQHVERIFLDVNNDGKTDLLLSGEVIFNAVPLATPLKVGP